MSSIQAQGIRQPKKIWAWFHGYTYNATLGSRTQNTDTIKNGYSLIIDPEAVADGFAAPTSNADFPSQAATPTNTYPTDSTYKAQMQIQGYGDDRHYIQVCKPTSGTAGRLFAGILCDLPPAGLLGTLQTGNGGYVGGCWVRLIVAGFTRAFTKANASIGTSLGLDLTASGTDLYALAAIDTTTATNNQLVGARSLVAHDTSTTASNSLVWVGGPACPAAI